jgi:hypothetical protein
MVEVAFEPPQDHTEVPFEDVLLEDDDIIADQSVYGVVRYRLRGARSFLNQQVDGESHTTDQPLNTTSNPTINTCFSTTKPGTLQRRRLAPSLNIPSAFLLPLREWSSRAVSGCNAAQCDGTADDCITHALHRHSLLIVYTRVGRVCPILPTCV